MSTKPRLNKTAVVFAVGVVALYCITAYALTNTPIASGTIASSEVFDGGAASLRMAELIIQPGDTIPWHYHPGRGYGIVKSGTITEDSGCGGTEEYSAGQAFEETTHSVHQVKNLGTTPAVVYSMVIAPAGGPGSIQTGGPLCGPPTNVGQCKYEGWTIFNHPRTFNDQGDCIQYVLTNK